MRKFFASESVTEGHPDKVCDRISDSILDAIIEKDPDARVACESFATTGMVFVMGEISTKSYVDIPKIVRNTIVDIGYVGSDMGFDGKTCGVSVSLNEQSSDIAQGVNHSFDSKNSDDIYDLMGAGDQGMVFGYATDETADYMPMPIYLAHKLAKRLTDVRKNNVIKGLRPDGKTQVIVEYEDDKPIRVDSILISSQHEENVDMDELKLSMKKHIIDYVFGADLNYLLDDKLKFYLNPTGKFVIGGPMGDTGLTGRKIVVDTYGGMGRVGGGAFSGKDPTKVDRSAAYYARYIAKNLVASGVAKKLEIGISYAIGMAHPLSVFLDTFGTSTISDEKLIELIYKLFDMRPAHIIEELDLKRPIYAQTSAYGHFGRDIFPWEKLDKVDIIKKELKELE